MLEPGPVTSDKGVRVEALERVQAGTRADSEHGPLAKGRCVNPRSSTVAA